MSHQTARTPKDRLLTPKETQLTSLGDSYDSTLAETIIGLHKTEVIHHRGPWRKSDELEYATQEWID